MKTQSRMLFMVFGLTLSACPGAEPGPSQPGQPPVEPLSEQQATNPPATTGTTGPTATTGPTTPLITFASVEAFQLAVAEAFCTRAKACCGSANLPYDEALCIERDIQAQGANDNTHTLSQPDAAACLAATQTINCAEPATWGESCARAVIPKNQKLPGEPCTDDVECMSSAPGAVALCGGTCFEFLPNGAAGDVCASTTAVSLFDCQQGFYCPYSEEEDTPCTTKVPMGAPCDTYNACADANAYCDLELEEPVCTPSIAVGDPCLSAYNDCGPNAQCDDVTNVCVRYKAIGESCVTGECDVGLSCSFNTQTCVSGFEIANSYTCGGD